MRRMIHDHETNETNKLIAVSADEPDTNNGNASHIYRCQYTNGAAIDIHTIEFQRGPIGVAGINGLTNEVLLAIVIDRLRCFQTSKYACRENALALTKLEESLHWLEARTRARVFRGVEGTSKP
jgi:hypothetical protein